MKLKNLILATMVTTFVSMALSFGLASAATYRLGSDTPVNFNPTRKVTKTAAYTVGASDSQVNVTTSSADIVITLPLISTTRGAGNSSAFKFLKTDSTAKKVVVTPATGNTIGGESTRYLVNQNDFMVISMGPGTDWSVDFESPYTQEDHEAGTTTFNGLNSTELASSTTIVGTNPSLTIGDAGAEDTKLVFDGNAADFHVGLEDASDDLKIGLGSTLGTTERITIAEGTGTLVTLGDGVTAVDTVVAFDGNAQDFYIGLDDTDDDLNFGLGSTAGTTTAFSIDEDQMTTYTGGLLGPAEITTGTDLLTISQCGTTIFLNSATEYATTLPAASTVPVGCGYTVIVKAAPSGANYTVATDSSEDLISGTLVVAGALVDCRTEEVVTFVDGAAIGDTITLVGDGAVWYVTGDALTAGKLTCTAT